jgi:hypothetical protein
MLPSNPMKESDGRPEGVGVDTENMLQGLQDTAECVTILFCQIYPFPEFVSGKPS